MTAAPKNIVVCCDDPSPTGDSNLIAIYRKVTREGQVVARHRSSSLFHLLLPGRAMRQDVVDACLVLVTNFEPGDRIFLFGAGRGAITVHRLADLLFRCGLVRPDVRERVDQAYRLYSRREWANAVEFKEQYARDCAPHFVGMFDALEPARRAPEVGKVLSPAVHFAYHAIALDDRVSRRRPFLWDESRRRPDQQMEQVWFPGAHADVIGATVDRGLADCALKWLVERARGCGALFSPDWELDIHPRPEDSPIARSAWPWLSLITEEPRKPPEGALIHESVLTRAAASSDYLPDLPRRQIVVRSSAERGVGDLRREAEFEAAQEEVKNKPQEARAWRRLADLALALNRSEDYLRAITRTIELQEAEAFTSNVGQEIRVATLEVADLDFFGSFRWKLAPRINVLLGKNGYGKSHLLTLIVTLLQYSRQQSGAFIVDRSQPTARAELQLTKNEHSHVVRLSKVGFEANEIGKVPVLAISELRFIDKSRDDIGKEDIGDDADLKVHGADRFLSHRPLGPLIHDFLHRLCIVAGERRTLELPIVDLYQEVVRKLTSTEFRIHKIERQGTSARYRIEVMTEGNDVPVLLQQASQGTLSIMAIVGLIFDFLTSTHPGIPENEVRHTSGVVFIDELDAHLHPSWQRKVLGLLRSTFPEVQFIVAAHSPLIVAGCKQGEVAVLRRAPNSPGFRLEQPDRHFLGATTSELYDVLFEIEEKDETFLQYSAMFPFREEIQREVSELETRRRLSSRDAAEYAKLAGQRRNSAHVQALALSLLAKTTRQPREESMLVEILGQAGITAPPSKVDAEALKGAFSLPAGDEARLAALEAQQRLPVEDEKRLSQLQEDLYYLGEFERVERKRSEQRTRESSAQLELQEKVIESAVQRSTDG